ncbi:MAG: hypothetical protein CMC08_06195 [Flavobacteriaceae bacterium]|nr:hypothetical protein [Flavobacteriaceae bacterium]
MNRITWLLLLLCVTANLAAQNEPATATGKPEKPPITMYKIISKERDTTHLDTSLSIHKWYRFNYLRRDRFELLPFSNVGQPYNTLAYDFDDLHLKPKFAAQGHHFNYMDVADISYYSVPTPLTELYFKTAFEQGQQLDAFFTINTSEQFNFSIAYKGVRSLGIYQNMLASTGNFRFTTNYHTKNKRYSIRAHYVAQDMLNEQNGGLTPNSIALFRNGDEEFEDRGRLDVNFENAENVLEGQRFYVDHQYELVGRRDSTRQTVVAVGNSLSYEEKFYEYRQDAPFEGFGPAYESADLFNKVTLDDFKAEAYAKLDNSLLGSIKGFAGYTQYNYGYNSVLILDEGRITNRLKGDLVHVGARYRKQYRGFELSGEGAINIAGEFDANYLTAAASFAFNEKNRVRATAKIHSVAPNFNFLLFQSDYENYNWQTNFNNVKTQQLTLQLQSETYLDATVTYTGIDDYAYFAVVPEGVTPTPRQFGERVDYVTAKAERTFRYGKFALANTILYQQVLSGEAALRVPQLVTRNALFYEDHWFKRALFLQTGVNVKYFTQYAMNGYDPVLGEFFVQDGEELGAFPIIDVFFNAKIRQTRIYFAYEHINQIFANQNDHFSAPGYPYRDAIIRFGLVWNFFL